MKTKFLNLGLIILAFGFVVCPNVEASTSYSIDSIVDTAEPGTNWFNSAPTLSAGTSYTVEITGDGTGGGPDPTAQLGLFADFDTSRLLFGDWAGFPDAPLIFNTVDGVFSGIPGVGTYTYKTTGTLSVPAWTPTGSGSGLVFLTPGSGTFLAPTENRIFNFDVEGDPSNVIPEPASLILLSLGLAGGFLRKKFSKAA